MNNPEMFFTRFSHHIFNGIAIIDLKNDTVEICRFKYEQKCEGKVLPLTEGINLVKNATLIDSSNISNISLHTVREIYLQGTSKKSYSFTAMVKENIVKRFVLTLYPVKGENIVYVTLTESEITENTITFMSRKTAINYSVNDIIYIGYGNHCVKIYTDAGCNNMYNISFKDAADMLLQYNNFLRSYKNCIINMDRVVKFEKDSFTMSNGDIVLIPKRRLKEIKNIYQEYITTKNMTK